MRSRVSKRPGNQTARAAPIIPCAPGHVIRTCLATSRTDTPRKCDKSLLFAQWNALYKNCAETYRTILKINVTQSNLCRKPM